MERKKQRKGLKLRAATLLATHRILLTVYMARRELKAPGDLMLNTSGGELRFTGCSNPSDLDNSLALNKLLDSRLIAVPMDPFALLPWSAPVFCYASKGYAANLYTHYPYSTTADDLQAVPVERAMILMGNGTKACNLSQCPYQEASALIYRFIEMTKGNSNAAQLLMNSFAWNPPAAKDVLVGDMTVHRYLLCHDRDDSAPIGAFCFHINYHYSGKQRVPYTELRVLGVEAIQRDNAEHVRLCQQAFLSVLDRVLKTDPESPPVTTITIPSPIGKTLCHTIYPASCALYLERYLLESSFGIQRLLGIGKFTHEYFGREDEAVAIGEGIRALFSPIEIRAFYAGQWKEKILIRNLREVPVDVKPVVREASTPTLLPPPPPLPYAFDHSPEPPPLPQTPDLVLGSSPLKPIVLDDM